MHYNSLCTCLNANAVYLIIAKRASKKEKKRIAPGKAAATAATTAAAAVVVSYHPCVTLKKYFLNDCLCIIELNEWVNLVYNALCVCVRNKPCTAAAAPE